MFTENFMPDSFVNTLLNHLIPKQSDKVDAIIIPALQPRSLSSEEVEIAQGPLAC